MTQQVINKSILDDLRHQHGLDIDKLAESILQYLPDFNAAKFKEAYKFAVKAHAGQMRKQAGVPYIVHPFETARILANIHADETTLIASFLHDVPEDTSFSLADVQKRFGKKVSYLVEGITKLSKVHYRHDMQKREVESLKKLFIHVAQDPRTMLIKLADRLHNMRTLEYMNVPEKRIRKAKETLEIFAPIAGLLGIKEIQAELEDLCFKHINPDIYDELKRRVKEIREGHRDDQEQMIDTVEKQLRTIGVESIVYNQDRNLYEIYKYLTKNRKSTKDFETRFQIVILVGSVYECYQALGLIHNTYRPVASGFKDYIALPKTNGYQSLHTTVFGPHGIITKFYIRTHHMHYEAQYGVAARYFIQGGTTEELLNANDPRQQWVEEVIQLQNEGFDRDDYLDELKADIFQDRINVFTPKGQAINLPQSATCIDFAYNIHTEVGHRAIRAVVNQINVPLSHVLHKGDVVKIVTTEYPKAPSYEWLNFAKTNFAKKKMKEYFKKESRTSKIKVGKKMLQKEYDRAGLGLISGIAKWRIHKYGQKHPLFNIQGIEDVLVHIAEGSIVPLDFINLIYKEDNKQPKPIVDTQLPSRRDLIKFSMKIICEQYVDLSKVVSVWQNKGNEAFLEVSEVKSDYYDNRVIIHSTILGKNYEVLSKICSELEQIDGVKEVQRIFRWKRALLQMSLFFGFGVWIAQPFLIYQIFKAENLSSLEQAIFSKLAIYISIGVLFGITLFLKKHTENSFPAIKENNRLWMTVLVLYLLAFSTIIFEIFAFQIYFNWIIIVGLTTALFIYLITQYWIYLSRFKRA